MNELRQKIIDHCAYMEILDPDYAFYAFNKYKAFLPWIGL